MRASHEAYAAKIYLVLPEMLQNVITKKGFRPCRQETRPREIRAEKREKAKKEKEINKVT